MMHGIIFSFWLVPRPRKLLLDQQREELLSVEQIIVPNTKDYLTCTKLEVFILCPDEEVYSKWPSGKRIC